MIFWSIFNGKKYMNNNNVEILHIWTEDGLRLQGVHYGVEEKETVVLMVHGMSGNSIENYFAHILGEALQKADVGFIYSHNRGYNHINDIVVRDDNPDEAHETVRMGATYERFDGCICDIDGWMKECRELGYRKIFLLGHSLGCNKVIHYFNKKNPQDIAGMILASPPDMVGLFKKLEPDYDGLLKEARENMEKGEPRKILSSIIWDWYYLSSQTFFDLAIDGCPADNLPVMRNPEKFEELVSVDVPIFGIMGEWDDIAINDLASDLALIKAKATACPDFSTAIIPKANHTYDKQEDAFSEAIKNWIVENNI